MGLIDDLNTLCRNFLWRGGLEKGANRVAWDVVCQNKENGGLGIKEVLSWNRAIMANWVWELAYERQGSAWLEWSRHYKLRNQGIWEIQYRPSDSGWWKKLLELRDTLRSTMGNEERAQVMAMQRRERYRYVYDQLTTELPQVSWSKWVRCPLNIPKTSFCCWLVCHGRIPVKGML